MLGAVAVRTYERTLTFLIIWLIAIPLHSIRFKIKKDTTKTIMLGLLISFFALIAEMSGVRMLRFNANGIEIIVSGELSK